MFSPCVYNTILYVWGVFLVSAVNVHLNKISVKYAHIPLGQRNIVVSPKIWKMDLLLPFDIKDKIFLTNVL